MPVTYSKNVETPEQHEFVAQCQKVNELINDQGWSVDGTISVLVTVLFAVLEQYESDDEVETINDIVTGLRLFAERGKTTGEKH